MERTAIILIIITIASKMLGFLREMVLAYFYGTSYISDAYMVAMTVPSIVFGFLGAAVSTGYIPIYNKVWKEKGEKGAIRYTNQLVNRLILGCFGIALVWMIFAEPMIKLMAAGFEGEVFQLTVHFSRITIWGIFFTGLTYIFIPYLQVREVYRIPAVIGFPLNIIMILSIIWSFYRGEEWLAIGSVIAWFSQVVCLIPALKKHGYSYEWVWGRGDRYIKEITYLAIPAIVGISVGQINGLVDRALASNLMEGGISALGYANRINGLVLGIFIISLTTPMYPLLARLKEEELTQEFKDVLRRGICNVSIIVIPAILAMVIFAEPIVEIMFGRGAFSHSAQILTTGSLRGYAWGLLGIGIGDVLSKGFFALKDTKTPTVASSISVLCNVILSIILAPQWGVLGIALASSISITLNACLLMIYMIRKMGNIGVRQIIKMYLKLLLATGIMGLISWKIYGVLIVCLEKQIAFIIVVIVGILVYGICIYLLKVEGVHKVVKALQCRK